MLIHTGSWGLKKNMAHVWCMFVDAVKFTNIFKNFLNKKSYKVNGWDSGMQDVSPNVAKYVFGISRRKLKVFII
jgi:hypothetical protein